MASGNIQDMKQFLVQCTCYLLRRILLKGVTNPSIIKFYKYSIETIMVTFLVKKVLRKYGHNHLHQSHIHRIDTTLLLKNVMP